MSQEDKYFYGLEAVDGLVSRLRQERPALVVVNSAQLQQVAEGGKALSRTLRGADSLIEFFEPSSVAALLEATSRLLKDLDVSAIGGNYGAQPRSRILMVDAAEDLTNEEVDALLRVLSGLKGVPLYVVLLAHTPDGLAGEPSLRRLQNKALFWHMDGQAPEPNVKEIEREFKPTLPLELAPLPEPESVPASTEPDSPSLKPLYISMALILILAVLVGGGWYLVQTQGASVSQWFSKVTAPLPPTPKPALADSTAQREKQVVASSSGQGEYVLSCGQYRDEELIALVESKIKTIAPTKRVEHDGVTELFAGGFMTLDAAQKALVVLLPIGPCQTEIRTLDEKSGNVSNSDPVDVKPDQGGKSHE